MSWKLMLATFGLNSLEMPYLAYAYLIYTHERGFPFPSILGHLDVIVGLFDLRGLRKFMFTFFGGLNLSGPEAGLMGRISFHRP